MQEAVAGLSRLRNAAALRAALTAIIFPLQVLGFAQPWAVGGEIGPERIGDLLTLLGIALVTGLVAVVLLIASWLLRVLGWGNLCRAKIRRFYCITRIVILAAPLLGVVVIVAGAVMVFFQVLAAGFEYASSVELPQKTTSIVLAGLVIVLAADVFEAVAALDLGQIYGVRALSVAALLLLASTALGATTNLVQLPAWVSSLASLLTFAMLTAGFHLARKAAAQLQPLREQPAQPGVQP